MKTHIYQKKSAFILGLIGVVAYYAIFVLVGKTLGSGIYTLNWLTGSFALIPCVLLVISVVTFLLGRWAISLFTVAGSLIGILIAELFGSNPQGGGFGQGHFGWLIFSIFEVCCILAGITVSIVHSLRSRS